MAALINESLEICEIINAFPILEERLKMHDLDIAGFQDGQSIYDYLKNKDYSDDEIDILVKRLNADVNYFLKNGEFPTVKLKSEKEVLAVDDEFDYVEEVEEYEEEE